MAIRFVDKEPEKARAKPETSEAQPETARRDTVAPEPATEADLAVTAPPPSSALRDADGELPGLPHAKPTPKPRGRKAPPAAGDGGVATTRERSRQQPEAASDEGLLPGLQVHAKPTPKPRGRKKAFG